jgi:DNA invertase Pin-like site-specific DNA recombinase
LVDEYCEVESGGKDDRPQLRRALDHCSLAGATLVIAKLDRLSRNVRFIAELQERGARFVAADMPEANEITVTIMSAMAQHERKAISERTRGALAAAKARGVKLGTPANLRNQRVGAANGNAAKALKAQEAAARVAPRIAEARISGAGSLRQVAEFLNARGFRTPRGTQWTAAQVMRAEDRVRSARNP